MQEGDGLTQITTGVRSTDTCDNQIYYEHRVMKRRTFVKASGTGLAAAAIARTLGATGTLSAAEQSGPA